ncbi:NiFe hydrogenase [Shewanella sp. AS1]|uniref:NiFe hydrogenase n=1 Tax=Shewanella sp. AS1 TaxID=2907626 RepID=UPI001F1BC197|nr:NiFe hydrogenase [Shewanella sp. AS1]MCE9678902.1 NiFe hydrogenase [Shewanella sp. AS1]
MNTIRFEFTCSRPVPLYGRLCNRYLAYASLETYIGYRQIDRLQHCYFIEAMGEQAQLEALADAIANDFLISVWLTDSNISLIDQISGSKEPLAEEAIGQEYCQQCAPQFGDNQAANFGDIALGCDFCHGEQRIDAAYLGFSATEIKSLCDALLTQGSIRLPGHHPIQLSLNPTGETGRPRLLICNPNTLNAQFHLSDRQILALSSIEKPSITARAIKSHPKLDAPLYDLCFAYNRLLIIIGETLRQRGVDWVFIEDGQLNPPLAFIRDNWVEVCNRQTCTTTIVSDAKALHDEALLINSQGYFLASQNKQQFKLEQATDSSNAIASFGSKLKPVELTDSEYGLCALHSVNAEHGLSGASAIVYFSKQHGGQIQTLDAKGQTELFFALPSLPQSGYEIYHQLEQSPQKQVLEKFKQQFPDDYVRLLNLKLPPNSDNLSSLWALGALLLGLPSRSMSVDDLSDALIASAMSHRGSNSPRVDYPLTRGEAHRSLNWCKTLGTLMSFRLADDDDKAKLAFGMHDSLTDYLANWLEHLDQNIGLKSVAIAGDEWNNPVLSQRFMLRVGKNFNVKHNQGVALEGNNYALGALLLKKRRR